jgi:hypothetical protein
MSIASFPPRRGYLLRKLLTVLCGIALFLVMVGLLGVWALGRFSPKLLDTMLATRSGAHLSVVANESNLFAGRLDYAGLTITNPTRWKEPQFLKVRRLGIDFDPLTFLEGGARIVHDLELDIEHLTIVGKADYHSDNNAKDIFNGLKPVPGPAVTSAEPAPQPFLIKHLRVRVERITIVTGDGTDQRKVLVDQAINLVFEARDITQGNFKGKVSGPLGAEVVATAISQQPQLLLDLARERVRRSVTETLRGEK